MRKPTSPEEIKLWNEARATLCANGINRHAASFLADLALRVRALEQHNEFHTYRDSPDNYNCGVARGNDRCVKKFGHSDVHQGETGDCWS